ncbi:inositol polyphosphate multikinase-like, partial [Dermacentor silvarum]|uniref:inositol polyphosphate multikinase-like n=1 Tax=Dermacentor silvarum TaxID=543639 RepID=UPI002100820D
IYASLAEVEYLRLDDVTREFRSPSVMDVKIGAQTYDPLAEPEKVALEEAKYPWSRQLGFRILGMRVFDKCEQKYHIYGKDYGLKQTPDTILEGVFCLSSEWLHMEKQCVKDKRPVSGWPVIYMLYVETLQDLVNWCEGNLKTSYMNAKGKY